MKYADLLRDPRWQKRRLEIMERDEWTCKMCADTESTLTVHHKTYRLDDSSPNIPHGTLRNPWDYLDCDLITLCDKCHEKEEATLVNFRDKMYLHIRAHCENAETLEAICDLVMWIGRKKYDDGDDKYQMSCEYNCAKVNHQDISNMISKISEAI